jgi:type IV secretion system protein VirB10
MTGSADEPVRTGDAPPGAADKLPPEALRLRARTAPITRFQRGRIILLATAAALLVAVIISVALRPHHVSGASAASDESDPAGGSGETLAALPAGYGDVPRLGPPLPGDLGQPILDRQRQLGDSRGAAPPAARDAAAAAREARAQTIEAARRSALLVSAPSGPTVTPAEQVDAGVAPAPAIAATIPTVPSPADAKQAFVDRPAAGDGVNPARLTSPASPYTLSAGSIIAASLVTGVNSDLPGMVVAQVTERVFDSATGRIELIPQGARLIGRCDHDVAFGQQRALIVWDRLILPDGRSIELGNEPAADPSGYAGIADRVDAHGWSLARGVALSTVLGVGGDLGFNGGSDLVDAIRQSAGQNVASAGNRLVSKDLDVQPTITIRPGARVLVALHRDLVLAPWQ